MSTVIKTKMVKIGNSQGVRIPKVVLEQLGFSTDVELEVQDGQIVLRPLRHARAGWEEIFRHMSERGDDHLLDADTLSLSSWDEEEWSWE